MTASTSKPLQLSLFANHVRMTQAITYANRNPYYLMRTMPSLFGERVLLREWGRIGSPGRVRRDRHRTTPCFLSTRRVGMDPRHLSKLAMAEADRSGEICLGAGGGSGEGMAKSYAAKTSRMALLAPDIVEGRVGARVILKLLDGTLPVDWEEQRGMMGI